MGGAASPITVNADYDTCPVWSPDGKQIAFASDRYGNFDVFVMPSTGGEATRLTFHSADDTPTSFTPDGTGVLFSSARLDSATNVQFPTNALDTSGQAMFAALNFSAIPSPRRS